MRYRALEGRFFPLFPELRELLEAQRVPTTAAERDLGRMVPWVFHRGGEAIRPFRRSWSRACAAAGVPRLIPHDLRRSAVRNLERASVPRSTAMAMVGHKTESVYRRYAIADEGMLREGAAKLAALHQAACRPNQLAPRGAARGGRRRRESKLRASRWRTRTHERREVVGRVGGGERI